MNQSIKYESPLFWPCRLKKGMLEVLDETLIPQKMNWIKVRSTTDAVRVIQQMKTRAFGQFLVVLSTFLLELDKGAKLPVEKLCARLAMTTDALNTSRPTFPFSEVTGMVMHWVKEARDKNEPVAPYIRARIEGYLAGIKARRLGRVEAIARVIEDGDCVLTHCNVSGELAMAAVLCKKQKKKVRFFATETRPYFQGARLTCWELKKAGADVTLIADNAVGTVMADELVNKVIVGSDRNCANGDFANKIGTYQIAVLAKEFGIPFYVLTQPSKKIPDGSAIPIELRPEIELLKFEGKRTMPAGAAGLYPGFDVVPHELVTGDIPINVN